MEEVGVKFTTEGEAAFYNALSKALQGVNSFDEALDKMGKQEGNSAALEQVRTKLNTMTQAEKDAALAAVQMANQTEQVGKSTAAAGNEFTKTEHSLIDFNMAIQAGKTVMEYAEKAYKATVGAVVEYETQINALSKVTGANVEETSRLIQTADDLKLSYDALSNMMEFRARKGMDTSIEGLGKLSDAYLELAPGLERSEFLMQNFGRSGTDIAEVMEQGSAAIKDISASQADNLIMTQKNIDAARQWERNLDEMGDTIHGVALEIGNDLIPKMNTLYKTADLVINFDNKLIAAEVEHEAVTRKTAKSYEDYITEMQRAAKAAGLVIDAEGNLIQIQDQGMGASTHKMIVAHFALTQAETDYNEALKHTTGSVWDNAAAQREGSVAMSRAVAPTREAASAMHDLEMQTNADKTAQENLTKAMNSAIKDSMQPLTQAMFDQKVMATLTGEALYIYALDAGLLDQKTYNALTSLDALTKQFDRNKDGVIDDTEATRAYWDALQKLHDINLTVTTTFIKIGEPYSPTVAPGYTPGAPPPTPTIPTPKPYDPANDPTLGDLFNNTVRAIGNMSGSALSQNISNSNQANYNLQVMTNQSPALVQQSFEMMRLLAG